MLYFGIIGGLFRWDGAHAERHSPCELYRRRKGTYITEHVLLDAHKYLKDTRYLLTYCGSIRYEHKGAYRNFELNMCRSVVSLWTRWSSTCFWARCKMFSPSACAFASCKAFRSCPSCPRQSWSSFLTSWECRPLQTVNTHPHTYI